MWPPLCIRIVMTVSTFARILIVALFLLSIAPWASLYALMISLNVNDGVLFLSSDHMTLASVLQDPNATLDELYTALFRESLSSSKGSANNHLHHWTIVIPWGVSLTLGIVIPFFLSCCTCIFQRLDNEQERSQMISKSSSQYRMILREEHYENDKQWRVDGNSFEGTCAICLNQYAVGDEIMFSSNKKCQHVFHGECILSWLVVKRKQQCPCCRQVFFPKKKLTR